MGPYNAPLEEIGVLGSQSLQTVVLGGYGITAYGFHHFSQACPNLTSVVLKDIILEYAVARTFEHSCNLSYLEITSSEICSEVLKSAAKYCPLLVTLKVNDDVKVLRNMHNL